MRVLTGTDQLPWPRQARNKKKLRLDMLDCRSKADLEAFLDEHKWNNTKLILTPDFVMQFPPSMREAASEVAACQTAKRGLRPKGMRVRL